MRKKKVAIVGIAGLPANYGGFETMVNYLTINKSSEIDFTVFCQKTTQANRLKEYNGSKLIYLPFYANGAQSIIYDIIAIIISWFKFDTILILGTPGIIILPILNLFRKTKTIINFGGLEWKRDKWGKFAKWYLKYTEGLAIKNATVMIADNQYFCDYIQKEYSSKSLLIEYGGDHSTILPVSNILRKKYLFLNLAYDISVSRAQPDNNLHLLLDAYSKVPERNLVLVSNYNKFEYGRKLKKKYSEFPNLFLQDAVYDLNELDTIRSNAQLYIHSHSLCGTAPSLVEAMNISLPVISFDVPTNRETTEDKALFFSDSKSLIEILKTMSAEKEKKISFNMKEIVLRRYTWERISNEYSSLF